jgi:hypothetical protein
MDPKALTAVIEIAMAFIMLVGPLAVLYCRLQMKIAEDGHERVRGISARLIQLIAVFLVFPTLVILAFSGLLDRPELGTLLGTLVGYLLASVKPPGKSESND